MFVSRKDSKLYVRAEFQAAVRRSVTIAPSDRPLGTHVFTAEADKKDPNLLRWSVVSLPVTARNAARTDDEDRSARRRKMAARLPRSSRWRRRTARPRRSTASPSRPKRWPGSRRSLTTGSSIVVSDHGINQGGETGEGTDFIVPLQ